MTNIIEELQNFNFSRIEAQIYLVLLKNKELNGSQIAKIINIPRTSVYMALENLYQKGAVYMLPGEPSLYKAQNPTILMNNLKDKLNESFNLIEKELSSFDIFSAVDQYWNIKRYNNSIQKIKEMIQNAEQEILINTNYDLQQFQEEFQNLKKKNIRVIVFSFEEINIEGLNIELYYNPKKKLESTIKRIMLVVDNKKVFISSSNPSGESLGTFTENSLLVSIAAEHIHHDIYLYKLDKVYEKDLIDKSIQIKSILENTLQKR